jgi:hypothetical protein
MILGMGLSGLLLLIWNLGIRLPDHKVPVTIHARSFKPVPGSEDIRTPLTQDAVVRLREEFQNAQSYLIQGSEELVEFISQTERLALAQGWRTEVSLKPAFQPAPDLPEACVVPAEIILINAPQTNPESTPAAYFRCLTFLRQLKDLNKKFEIASIILKTGSEGLQSAEMKLHIWTRPSDEKTPAK